jgi:hypothetical protein
MKSLLAALLLVVTPAAATEIPLDLAGLPRQPALLVAHGQTISCEGVPLAALLARAGIPAGEALRGTALASVIIATGKDGYRIVFSLAEIDAKLGNNSVFVVDRCAGAPVAADDGPLRLVVPGEARAARSVRQLVALRVAVVPE